MTEPEKERPHRDQATGDAGNTRRIAGLSFEALSLIFDGIIAIAAIVGSVFVYRQLISMNGQLAVMREQMKDARAAAKSADITTDRQLKIAEKQAGSQQILADANKDIAASATKSAKATEQLARATADAAAASHRLAESAGQSTAATQRLAAAANDANAVSRELVKTTHQVGEINQNAQRAFVFVKDVVLQKVTYADYYRRLYEANGIPSYLVQIPAEPGYQQTMLWQANLVWENSGSTPTKKLSITRSFWVDSEQKADEPTFDVLTIPLPDRGFAQLDDQHAFIGPKQEAQIMSGFITAGPSFMRFLEVLSGPTKYYVFGVATYRDILNPTYAHRTEYCFYIQLAVDLGTKLDSAPINPPDAKLIPCAKHNCMDEECEEQREGQPNK